MVYNNVARARTKFLSGASFLCFFLFKRHPEPLIEHSLASRTEGAVIWVMKLSKGNDYSKFAEHSSCGKEN